ncbi:restriction endonuclease subunit S [Desulfovibrio desulfuricans]|uniref:Restriction endonuclease subunit S n=1 Tax=Desulfovibrio desulfuricans TaxID=876 RepID=A0A4P7UFI2_DESDE|nr:restriction endonuclease subunit S [Desulfovibrio desulfuricans]QCC84703.1 restriction endonuclease subunit S [Desulfovibrio desulfuricans]
METRWPLATIDSLCTSVTSGGTPSRSNPAYYKNGTIPWIKTGELKDWYIDSIQEQITEVALRESSAKLFPNDTVLFAMYGDGKTMGSVGLLRKPCATNQACCAMLADSSKCDAKFLLYSLIYFRPAILKLTIAGAQRNLNGTTIKQFKIGVPPIPTQRRIASILSAYDELIENNTRRIAILEEMARRIYEEWFVRFRFPGHEQVKMVESELGLIPEGWSLCRLDELYKTASGGTPSRQRAEYFGGNIHWVKTQELQNNWIFETSEKITEIGLANSSAKIFPTGTVLVAMYGATIGQLGILGVAAATNQACCAVIPRLENFGTTYAYLTLQVRRQELIDLRAGAAQQNINQIVVRQFPMLVPSDHSLLPRFTATVTPLLELSSVLQRTNANLRATRDLLLPKLISGEIDVSTLPEPEEVITA